MKQSELHAIAQRLLQQGRMPDVATIGRAVKHAAGNGYGEPFAAVSSSTREGSKFPDAVADLESPEHKELESETPRGTTGIGFWADGAEPSRIVTGASPKDAARLGLKYQQKAVLHFLPHPDGPHDYYRIDTKGTRGPGTENIARILQDHGIEYKTLTPDGGVHVVDQEGILGPNVKAAAKALGGSVQHLKGTASLIGSFDSREEGAKEFQRILAEGSDASTRPS